MEKLKIILLFNVLIWSNGYTQSICDNLFAFGFENVFKWNTVFVEKEIEDNFVRMIMFEDISNIHDRIIVYQLTKLNERKIEEYIKPEESIIDTLKNPYSDVNTLIVKNKNNPEKLYALIDHFGYALNVSYVDKKKLEQEKFVELIKTYINLKLDF